MTIQLYTAEQLLATMRLSGAINDVGSAGSTDADLLSHLNHCLLYELVPDLMKAREEYFVITRRQAISGTTRYRIPPRAIGQKLRDLMLVDGSGSRTALIRISREDITQGYIAGSSSSPFGFYPEGNYIILWPDTGSASGTLEMSYFFRPGQLVLSTETRTIQSVDTTAQTITLVSTPPTTWDASKLYDIHSAESGAEIKLFDVALSDLTGAILTATNAIDGSEYGTYVPAAGDYVCLAGEAALPALPRELHPALVEAATARYMASVTDAEASKLHSEQLNRMLQNAGVMVENRVSGRPQKIIRRSPFF